MWYILPVPREKVKCCMSMLLTGVKTDLGQPPIAACHDGGVGA